MGLHEIYCEKVNILTYIPILEIKEMKINFCENSHSLIKIKAILQEKILDSSSFLDKDIKAVFKESGEILFRGLIERVALCVEGNYQEVEIFGCSYTKKLDRYKKYRSFQDIGAAYGTILHEIIETYEGTAVKWNIGDDRVLGMPIIQYRETDWELIKRLASHFGEVIYPDTASTRSGFHFGIKKGMDRSGENMELLSIGMCAISFMDEAGEYAIQKKRALYRKVKSREVWHIGDYVITDGRIYTVYRIAIHFLHQEIIFIYQLGETGMYQQQRRCNELLAGTYLRGTIRKMEGEKVYLQLDIDDKINSDYGWPWVPETNNLCYCMPETGTKAALYLPSREEKEGIAVHVVDEMGASPNDIRQREFVTPYEKKIGLYPDELFVQGKQAELSIADQTGISFNSSQSFSMLATGDITIKGKRITVNAPLRVLCNNPQSNIELCSDFNFYAPEGVKMQATDVSEVDCSEEKKISSDDSFWQASVKALACIPNVDMAKINQDSVIDMVAIGSVAAVAEGEAIIALSEVMGGKRECETSFPAVFGSMGTYVVKGGYRLPKEG